jgi:hypothetical protein
LSILEHQKPYLCREQLLPGKGGAQVALTHHLLT